MKNIAKNATKSIFKKRKFWLIIIIALAIILVVIGKINDRKNKQYFTRQGFAINQVKDDSAKPFSDDELTAADTALNNGIKINDPKEDWYPVAKGTKQPDGRYDNPAPYPLPWTDIKSLTIGADHKYLYVKFEFWGAFPKKSVIYNKDFISSVTAKITNFTFTRNDGQVDYADLIQNVWYCDMQDKTQSGDKPMVSQLAMISPNGQSEQQEILYKTMTSKGLLEGGPGTNYLLAAYPLSLFEIKFGDEVSFSAAFEAGSTKFHHEAIDNMLEEQNAKQGNTIKYLLGSNTYEEIINSDYYVPNK
ncbi:MAG TPA: hypothetical protein PK737_02600 [Bacilli bacterium]|nr:hypothetical protein [Bacilli bacterium]